MELIKEIEFYKRLEGDLYKVVIKYGLSDDKTNHQMFMSVYQVLNETTMKLDKVFQDEVTDLIGIDNVYKVPDELVMTDFRKKVNRELESLVASKNAAKKNIETVEFLMESLKEDDDNE